MRAHAAQNDDGEHDGGFPEGEGIGGDRTLPGGVKRARQSGKRRADGERGEFDPGGIDAERAAGDFVLTQRFPGAANRHAQEAVNHPQRQQAEAEDDEVEEDAALFGVEGDADEFVEGRFARAALAGEDDVKQPRLRDIVDALWAVGEAVQIVEQDADNFAEAESNDGEVVAAQA